MLLGFLLLATLLGLSTVSSASESGSPALYDVEYFTLANGIDVVLKKRTHAPNAAVRLAVGVGFRHFPCGKQETPHFLEHLLFMGTSKYNEADLRKRIEDRGGSLNATTGSTDTIYRIDIFDAHLPVAIETLYDMMTDTVITPRTIESARQVIYRERKGNYSWFVRWLYEKDLFKSAGTKARELLLPSIECPGLITPDGITEADVREAYAQHYVPANMTLVAVGNFDRAKLVTQIKSTFGKLPPKASNGQKLVSPPYRTQKEEATGLLSPFVGSDGAVGIAYRTPGRSSPDFPALSLLARYFQRIVLERVRMKEALSYGPNVIYHTEEDFGLFIAAADTSLEKLERAKGLLEGGVRWLKAGWIEPAQLAAVKHGMIREAAILYESNSATADYYVANLPQLKRDGTLTSLEAKINTITPDDLQRLAIQYLQNDSRVIVREIPTLTFTQFFITLGLLLIALTAGSVYAVRRLAQWRRRRARERKFSNLGDLHEVGSQ